MKIAYQYFHNKDGYHYKIDDDTEPSVGIYLDKARASLQEKKYFVYAPVTGDNALFLQSTLDEQNCQFVCGVFCTKDEIDRSPIACCASLISERLTSVDQRPVVLFGAKEKSAFVPFSPKPVFAKIVDALLNANEEEQIVLSAATAEEATAYVSAIDRIFPSSFIKKCGYAVSSLQKVDKSLLLSCGEGESVKAFIRVSVLGRKLSDSDFANLCSDAIVFDIAGERDNYALSEKNGNFSRAIAELDLTDRSQVEDFAERIAKAFDENGKMDRSLFNIVVVSLLYGEKEDDESLRALLNAYHRANEKGKELLANEAIFAVRRVLEKYAYEDGVTKLALAIREQKKNIAAETQEEFIQCCSSNFDFLSPELREDFSSALSSEPSGNAYRSFRDSLLKHSPQEDKTPYFAFLAKTIVNGKKNWSQETYASAVAALVDYADVSKALLYISTEDYVHGEKLFSCLSDFSMEDRVFVAAALMLPAYYFKARDDYKKLRVCGLKTALHGKTDKKTELQMLVRIKQEMLKLGEIIPTHPTLSNMEVFIFDDSTRLGEEWIASLVNELDLTQMMDVYRMIEQIPYTRLEVELYKCLLNVDKINTAIDRMPDREFLKELESRYFAMRAKHQRDVGKVEKINAILNHINGYRTQEALREKIVNFRCSFVNDMYETLSPSIRKKNVSTDLRVVFEKGQDERSTYTVSNVVVAPTVVTKLSKLFNTDNRTYRGTGKKISFKFLKVFFYLFLSLVILALPAAIRLIVGGVYSLSVFVEYLCETNVFLTAFPVATFIVYLLTYACAFPKKRAKRAERNTFILVLLPEIFLVLGMILFYFIGTDLSAILGGAFIYGKL